MTEHKNIYMALCAAQQEFGAVQKGSLNPAFKSKYADLADVAGVVIPTLAKHGVCVMHYLVGEELGAMRTEFVHGVTETRVSCDVPLAVDKKNMQGMKSATTYAKRIGLESLSGVAPEDDDGNAAAQNPPRHEPKGPSTKDIDEAKSVMLAAPDLAALKSAFMALPPQIKAHGDVINAKDARKAELEFKENDLAAIELGHDGASRDNADLGGDDIPDFNSEAEKNG